MSLFFAELRKVWGGRVFPALLAILAASNLLLLWMGTRPTAKQPPASAYRAVGAELSDKTMEEKGAYLHDKYTEIESLVKIVQNATDKMLPKAAAVTHSIIGRLMGLPNQNRFR